MDNRTPAWSADDNREQRDEEAQAHSFASDALGRHAGDPSEDSERGGHSNPAGLLPDDTPDLVETMTAMVRSGVIDNGAFAGEPMHDDEEDRYGFTEGDGDPEERQ